MTIEKLPNCLMIKGGWILHVVKRMADVAIYKGVKQGSTTYFILDIYTVPCFDLDIKVGYCEMFVFVEPYVKNS